MTRDNNLPAEANRYDGAPAPDRHAGVNAADLKAAAAEAKAELECEHCGHDAFDDLRQVPERFGHSCSRRQGRQPAPIWLCESCRDDHDPEAEYRERQRKRDATTVMFECGIVETATKPEPETVTEEVQVGWTEDDEPIYETEEHELPHQDLRPRIPAECACGAEIDSVYY